MSVEELVARMHAMEMRIAEQTTQIATHQANLEAAAVELNNRAQQVDDLRAQAGQNRTPAARLPKFPSPRPWDGKGDILVKFAIPVQTWLKHYEMEGTAAGVELAVAYLPPFLQIRWETYRSECTANNTPLPTTFQDFYTLARSWYPQPDQTRQAMEKLDTLRHKRNQIVEYNEAWAWVMLELGASITSYTAKFKYFKGLQYDLQRDLEGKFNFSTVTHSELMSLATEAEARQRLAYNRDRPWRPAHRTEPVNQYHHAGPAPMEIGNVQRVRGGGGNARVGAHRAADVVKPFTGMCYLCKRKGHKAADCPSKGHRN